MDLDFKKTLTTTLHHWLSLMGRSLWDWTHLAYAGYITEVNKTDPNISKSHSNRFIKYNINVSQLRPVSLVGLTAMGSASSVFPDRVTQAT